MLENLRRRNRELAHLASNLLILLALLYDCRLICGENLSHAQDRLDVVGACVADFRNWRNNSTVRGELWRVLKYKCHLLGYARAWWNRVARRIPAHAVISQPEPLRPLRPADRKIGD